MSCFDIRVWLVSGPLWPGLFTAALAGVSLGEGLDRLDEGVGFRVLLRGMNVSRVVALRSGSDARCASLALSHLSLSLSLFV
jgi:hypothetical protein